MAGACTPDSENNPKPQTTSVQISGKDYPVVTIGNQIWTSVNYAGLGGVAYKTGVEKPEYGRYYTLVEAKAVTLPAGWRLPTMEDYIKLGESQGVVFTNFRATNQEAIKKLVSKTNWRVVPGNNASGFNAFPAGYIYQQSEPIDGDISEFWLADGKTMSIQEGANGIAHNMMFYDNSNEPGYKFNLRFVRDK